MKISEYIAFKWITLKKNKQTENETEILKERSQEKRQQIIDELRLV